MRLIDADALIEELKSCHFLGAPYVDAGISIAIGKACDAPTIEPEQKKGRGMQKRKVDELISYFNRKVSDMDIDRKYKMELLGMITAIGLSMRR